MDAGRQMGRATVLVALLGACLAPPDEGRANVEADGGAPDAAAASCPDRYGAAFGKSRYLVLDGAVNAVEAEALCADDGTHLLVIDEEGENAHVDSLSAERLWLGLIDPGDAGGMSAAWTWVTGAPLGEAVWDTAEDATPEPDGSGACAIIDPDSMIEGGWDDTGCVGNTLPLPVCECDGDAAVLQVPG